MYRKEADPWGSAPAEGGQSLCSVLRGQVDGGGGEEGDAMAELTVWGRRKVQKGRAGERVGPKRKGEIVIVLPPN